MRHYLNILKILYFVYFKVKFGRKFTFLTNQQYGYHVKDTIYLLFRKSLGCLYITKIENNFEVKINRIGDGITIHSKLLVDLIQRKLIDIPIVDIEVKIRDEKFEELLK